MAQGFEIIIIRTSIGRLPYGMTSIRRSLEATIATGSSYFNAGRHRECAELYYDCATRLLASPHLPQNLRLALQQAMARTAEEYRRSGDSRGPAWELRRALDFVLSSLPASDPGRPAYHQTGYAVGSRPA